MDQPLKIILIGDAGVGKTSILMRFKNDIFNNDESCQPLLFNFNQSIVVNGKDYQLGLWDTSGNTNYENIRCGYYKDVRAHYIVILCYIILNDFSFSFRRQTASLFVMTLLIRIHMRMLEMYGCQKY